MPFPIHCDAAGELAAVPKDTQAEACGEYNNAGLEKSQVEPDAWGKGCCGAALAALAGNRQPLELLGLSAEIPWQRPTLPPRCQGSTIGAGGLNFLVRNGAGCFPSAMVTKGSQAAKRMQFV